jgi:hypothetical protein
MRAFTICSNNYLHKAATLLSSIKKLSDVPVYLFLADVKNKTIDYSQFGFAEVVLLEDLQIPNLQWMKENYSIVELNTAIKPFAFSYLFQKTDADSLYYFDPDIYVYQPLSQFKSLWEAGSVLLTPHILTAIPIDEKFPGENLFLNHGIYNLGFLALKKDKVAFNLLKWWSDRLAEKCIIDLAEGYFVDQLWFNLVPILFKSVVITDHLGCNVAYWNLHERSISQTGGTYVVNNSLPLMFYHFSGIDSDLEQIHYHEKYRFNFDDQPSLRTLYKEYLEAVNTHQPESYLQYQYFDGHYPILPSRPTIISRALSKIKRFPNK